MLTGEELHQNQGSGGKVAGTFEKAGSLLGRPLSGRQSRCCPCFFRRHFFAQCSVTHTHAFWELEPSHKPKAGVNVNDDCTGA